MQSLRHVAKSDSLTLTWQTPATSRGVITGYKVSFQLRKRSTCSYVHEKWADDVTVTSLSYDLIGLHPYSEYNVRVVPVNGAGDGVDQTLNVRTAAAGILIYSVLASVSCPKALYQLESDNIFRITVVVADWLGWNPYHHSSFWTVSDWMILKIQTYILLELLVCIVRMT